MNNGACSNARLLLSRHTSSWPSSTVFRDLARLDDLSDKCCKLPFGNRFRNLTGHDGAKKRCKSADAPQTWRTGSCSVWPGRRAWQRPGWRRQRQPQRPWIGRRSAGQTWRTHQRYSCQRRKRLRPKKADTAAHQPPRQDSKKHSA